MIHQNYNQLARKFGTLLALTHHNDDQRPMVLTAIRQAIALFKEENPLFNEKVFATILVRTAFPTDRSKDTLIETLLKPSNCRL